MALRESMISVKIQVRSAMVPPDTPGITLAAPMPKPLIPVIMFLVNPFIVNIIYVYLIVSR